MGVMFTWLFNGRVCRFKCVLLLPNRMLRQDPTTSPSSPSSSHSVERCDPACSEHHARITLYTWSRVSQIIHLFFICHVFFPHNAHWRTLWSSAVDHCGQFGIPDSKLTAAFKPSKIIHIAEIRKCDSFKPQEKISLHMNQ